jgi:hypothetical protein
MQMADNIPTPDDTVAPDPITGGVIGGEDAEQAAVLPEKSDELVLDVPEKK